jgi:transcriptional regulator with XRE-family HTH domain
MDTTDSDLTSQILYYRHERGLSQKELATLSGVSVPALSAIECRRVGASAATVLKLCSALGVTANDLLMGPPRSAPTTTIGRLLYILRDGPMTTRQLAEIVDRPRRTVQSMLYHAKLAGRVAYIAKRSRWELVK